MADERFRNIDWDKIWQIPQDDKLTGAFSFRDQAIKFERNDSKTQSEVWLENGPSIEVRMNGPVGISQNGEVLYTRGFNGCTALLIRALEAEGRATGALGHRHTESRRNLADVEQITGIVTPGSRLYGTILYPQDPHRRELVGVSAITDDLESHLLERYKDRWEDIRKVGYPIYEGFPGGVNSGRLVYNVQAGVWHFREQGNKLIGEERPSSGLLFKTPI